MIIIKKHFIFIIVIFSFLIFYSCKTNEITDSDANNLIITKPQSIQDYIKDLHKKGKALQVLDLSHKQLNEVPDLSKLKVSSLDLSNNQLSSIDFSKLPDSLNLLDISHNEFTGNFLINDEDKKHIDTLDISYNKLDYISIAPHIYKLDASHNDLTAITFDHKNIEYLDISYNRYHSNRTEFDPYLIKTIIRDSMANDKPLIANWRSEGPVQCPIENEYSRIDNPE